MLNKLVQIWKARDLRNKVIYVMAMLAIFRFAAHIPIPGVDIAALRQFFQSSDILGLLNVFSGGSMENFSIVMMGVAPYITASIVFQLLAMIVPKLEEMNKEEAGRQKINMWTRWLTVPLAMMQSYGMITIIRRSSFQILGDIGAFQFMSMIITISAGTVFLMWIGELISEKKIGNGISLMIFAGIVSGIPQSLQQTALNFDTSKLITMISFAILAVVTVLGVVYITEAQRNIPVQYARQIRGNRAYGGTSTHLPLRVNMAGVIPIIFAISVILFPPMIAQFFLQAKSAWLVSAAEWVIRVFQGQLFYGVSYFVLVFAFTYFYTEVVFHPNQIAENLQKQGGFIPGIRPGKATENYLSYTTHRIIFVGALFLSVIAILPLVVQYFYPDLSALKIGGTSILIVVGVVIETVKQIEAQLTMRQYDGL